MNQKGIMFSLMVLIMILSVIALQDVFRESKIAQQRNPEKTRIFSVNEKYENINRNIVDLFKEDYLREVSQRNLPFNYLIDGNKIKFNHSIPWDKGTIENYFDTINTYRIFISDKNYSNAFDGIFTQVETLQNSEWGGTATDTHFLIQPFCTNFETGDLNRARITESFASQCLNSFDENKMRRFDVDIVVRNSNEDFNSVFCSNGCSSQNFNPSNSNPYYRLVIDDTKCSSKCNLSQTVFSKHFLADDNETIILSGAASKPLRIRFMNGVLVQRNGDFFVDSNIQVQFDQNISDLFFLDFNFTLTEPDFNIVKTNNPQKLN